ncbi:MAG: thiamine pyrophosphate-dependent enzyme, partial [Proteobacteria bacterium]|nr:thiamine pyrophosphate-dependent enzyme [Pseudomonadota bacterium]
IQEAERPIIIAGNETTSEGARRALVEFAEKYSLPVFPSYAHQHVMPHDHPCYAGEAGVRPPDGVKANAQAADLVLAVGTRLTNKGSFTWSVPSRAQKLIHIYPDADMIGRVYPAEHGVVCTSESFMTAMSALNAPPPSDSRKNWLAKTHKGYTDTYTFTPRESSDGVEFGHVVQAMREQLAGDAIISVDVGSFASWLHQKFPFQKDQVLLAAESGAMGMGIPGAIAAAIRHPDRQVIALAGDGGALMTGSEMATAVKENANVVIFVSNNGQYGTIRVHQEVHHPSRTTGINDLVNPDFASYAESFGAKGLRIRKPEDAAGVLAEALAHKGPVMVDVSSSLENISSGTTITELRAAK